MPWVSSENVSFDNKLQLKGRHAGLRRRKPQAETVSRRSLQYEHRSPRPTNLHFEVTVILSKLKFIPPGDEVISTPYWTLPTFMSPK